MYRYGIGCPEFGGNKTRLPSGPDAAGEAYSGPLASTQPLSVRGAKRTAGRRNPDEGSLHWIASPGNAPRAGCFGRRPGPPYFTPSSGL
jgi:hypothetical protein